MAAPSPGIRHAVYLGGYPFTTGVASIADLSPATMEVQRRLLDGTLVRYTAAPFAGACDRPGKYTFQLAFQRLKASEQAAAAAIASSAASLDFCPWIEFAETFTIPPNTAYGGTLARRDGYSECPPLVVPTPSTDLVPRLTIEGVSTPITLGAVLNYRTPWTAAGVSGGTPETAIVWYHPLFLVQVTRSAVGYPLPHRTTATFTLEEV